MDKFISYLKLGGARLVVARLLGCFLLVTATLKIHGLWVDPYGQENFLALPWLQWLTIEVEVLLGLWLLSGVANRLALIASLAVFTIFAALSFTLAWQGQTDCGCFGKVKVNPWFTFGLDLVVVVVVLAVTLWRSGSAEDLSKTRLSGFLMNCVQVAAFTAVLLGLLVTGIAIYAGDPWAAIAKLRGETLTVTPAITELGEGVAGKQLTFQVQLRNYSDNPINVVGGTTSCACIATQDLPITIPAGGNQSINVKIKFSGSPGKFAHRFVLYSDSEERLTVARFSGVIMPATPQANLKGIESSLSSSNHRLSDTHIEEPELSANKE